MPDSNPTRSPLRTLRGLWIALAVLASPLVSAESRAVPIAEWDLANATGQTASVLFSDANLSATDIAPSAGITAWSSTAQDGFVAASGWPTSAPDATAYYEFSITADPGYTVQYETITLALFRGIQGANHGADLWDLHASTDAFATSNIALQTFDISASAADEQILFTDADISGVGTVGGTVTFRLFGYDYTSTSDFSGLGNDSGWLIGGTGANPVVGGVVNAPLPEPGTGLLVSFGLVMLAVARRPARAAATHA